MSSFDRFLRFTPREIIQVQEQLLDHLVALRNGPLAVERAGPVLDLLRMFSTDYVGLILRHFAPDEMKFPFKFGHAEFNVLASILEDVLLAAGLEHKPAAPGVQVTFAPAQITAESDPEALEQRIREALSRLPSLFNRN